MITLRDKYMLGNKHILFSYVKYILHILQKGEINMENVKARYFYLCMNGICANRESIESDEINIDILYKTCPKCGDVMKLCEIDELEYDEETEE